ncbi:MAG: GTPase RsgA [Anaerotruncus sp.]|nr:MAG: GTPase RsgA [Anaerotruncus sp.]
MKKIYKNAGFDVYCCNPSEPGGAEQIKSLLAGKCSAFTGNTGVGKSTLLNAIEVGLELPTGETSKKTRQGKAHNAPLRAFFKVCGGYVADTPGFFFN